MVTLVITECPGMKWYQQVFLEHLLGQELISVKYHKNNVILTSTEHSRRFMHREFNLAYFYRVQVAPLCYVDAWLQNSI